MARLTRRRFVATSGALVALPAPRPLNARGQAADVGELRVDKDIVFGMGGSKTLTLDVYRPLAGTTAKRTAIVHLFAGGFAAGSKDANYIVNDVKALGTRGYTSVAANYRLAREGPWPAQIHDAKAAVRWTRANATRLGVEPNRIVVAGYGAGGLLALLAAGTAGRAEFEGETGTSGVSSQVNACIGVYPLTTPENAAALFAPGQATRENLTAASPATYSLEGLRTDDLHSWHRRRHRASAIERRLLVEAARARSSSGAESRPGRGWRLRHGGARRGGDDGPRDQSIPRPIARESGALSEVRWPRRGTGRARSPATGGARGELDLALLRARNRQPESLDQASRKDLDADRQEKERRETKQNDGPCAPSAPSRRAAYR